MQIQPGEHSRAAASGPRSRQWNIPKKTSTREHDVSQDSQEKGRLVQHASEGSASRSRRRAAGIWKGGDWARSGGGRRATLKGGRATEKVQPSSVRAWTRPAEHTPSSCHGRPRGSPRPPGHASYGEDRGTNVLARDSRRRRRKPAVQAMHHDAVGRSWRPHGQCVSPALPHWRSGGLGRAFRGSDEACGGLARRRRPPGSPISGGHSWCLSDGSSRRCSRLD